MFRVDYVVTKTGNIPFIKFIDLLNKDEQAKVLATVNKFCQLKNQKINIPVKLSSYIRDGIFELRISLENRKSRVLYFFIERQRIILTHGFIKKTNKTPKKEIERAIKLRKAYMTSIVEDK